VDVNAGDALARSAVEGAHERPRLRDLVALAPNLHVRWSGVTSTIAALVPRQARRIAIAALGPNLPPDVPRIASSDLIAAGWTRPPGRPFRIWHARRNDEMIAGLVLRDVMRQPWRLVFTSAALRDHTAFTRSLISRMDALIATSEFAAAYLKREATVIHHGIDLERFRPAADRAAAWRETGLPGTRGIGVFGRARESKGTDLFVEAMIRLLPHYPGVTAVMTGATDDQAFVRRLAARIAQSGLSERIRLLGERPREEVPLWFSRVSVYVAPQRWEGFGLTPLEAMASGAAVVATRTGAAPLLVADGETGALVEPGDLDALTAAIEPLLADPDLAVRMGAAGRRKAEAQHDIEGEVAAIGAVYEEVWRRG
jgi:mannosyltransferase